MHKKERRYKWTQCWGPWKQGTKKKEKLVGDNIIGEKYIVILRLSSLQLSLGSALIAICSSEPL